MFKTISQTFRAVDKAGNGYFVIHDLLVGEAAAYYWPRGTQDAERIGQAKTAVDACKLCDEHATQRGESLRVAS